MKKTTVESYQLLLEAKVVNMLQPKKLANHSLNAVKVIILTLKTRKVQVRRKQLKTQICSSFWMKPQLKS